MTSPRPEEMLAKTTPGGGQARRWPDLPFPQQPHPLRCLVTASSVLAQLRGAGKGSVVGWGAPGLQQNRPLLCRPSHREWSLHPPSYQSRGKNSSWMPPPPVSQSHGFSAHLSLHLTHPFPSTSPTTYPSKLTSSPISYLCNPRSF